MQKTGFNLPEQKPFEKYLNEIGATSSESTIILTKLTAMLSVLGMSDKSENLVEAMRKFEIEFWKRYEEKNKAFNESTENRNYMIQEQEVLVKERREQRARQQLENDRKVQEAKNQAYQEKNKKKNNMTQLKGRRNNERSQKKVLKKVKSEPKLNEDEEDQNKYLGQLLSKNLSAVNMHDTTSEALVAHTQQVQGDVHIQANHDQPQ